MYTREWFAVKLAKIRDMMHHDLREARSEAELDAILREAGVHYRQVERAVYEVTDLFWDSEIHRLVNRMLDSEAEQRAFFARYNVPHETLTPII